MYILRLVLLILILMNIKMVLGIESIQSKICWYLDNQWTKALWMIGTFENVVLLVMVVSMVERNNYFVMMTSSDILVLVIMLSIYHEIYFSFVVSPYPMLIV